MPYIFGINPVTEALISKQPIDKIYLQTGKTGPEISRIYQLAKNLRIPVVTADRRKMLTLSDARKHRGVVALLSALNYFPLEDLIEKIQKRGDVPNIIVIDKIQDPHNLGAIIRSSEVLGANGIVFSLRESVPITDVVIKASAGAVFHIDISKVENTSNAVEYLKNCGLWIYASSSHAEKNLWEMDFSKPQAIIIGSECKGVRPLLLKKSDDTFQIPQLGETESLNASVASGVILAEILRQRNGLKNN